MLGELPQFLRGTVQAKPCQLYDCLLNPVPNNVLILCEVPQDTWVSSQLSSGYRWKNKLFNLSDTNDVLVICHFTSY